MSDIISQISETIGKIKLLYRLLISIVIIILFSGGYFFMMITPKFDDQFRVMEEGKRLQLQLIKQKKHAKQLDAVKALKKQKQLEFNKVSKVLPEEEKIASLLYNLTKIGRESRLKFTLFKPEKEIDKKFYAEIPVSIEVKGHFGDLLEFFDKLSKLPRIINISKVKLVQAKVEKDQDPSVLNIQCEAVTYKFIEKS